MLPVKFVKPFFWVNIMISEFYRISRINYNKVNISSSAPVFSEIEIIYRDNIIFLLKNIITFWWQSFWKLGKEITDEYKMKKLKLRFWEHLLDLLVKHT